MKIHVQVLIPHQRGSPCLSLLGLLQQDLADFSVLIRDEGPPAPSDASDMAMIDVLARNGRSVSTIRVMESRGLFQARRELFEASSGDILVWLDSDVVLRHDALLHIAGRMWKDDFPPFYFAMQGVKYEGYATRTYHNEINQLGSLLNHKTEQEIRALPERDGSFCDLALGAAFRQEFEHFPWHMTLPLIGLGGEDVTISGMLGQSTGKKVLLAPYVFGHHIHRPMTQWHWETPTDLLVHLRCRAAGVSEKILESIFPHHKDVPL
jgi:hypothetical protein